MNRRHSSVRLCPDCGGILQPTGPEALTSAELTTGDGLERNTRQCLLCGFVDESKDPDPVPEPC